MTRKQSILPQGIKILSDDTLTRAPEAGIARLNEFFNKEIHPVILRGIQYFFSKNLKTTQCNKTNPPITEPARKILSEFLP